MAIVVGIVNGCGRGIDRVVETNPRRYSYVALYKVLIHCTSYLKQLYLDKKTECFSYKGGCGVCEWMCIEAFKRRACLGYRQTVSGYQ